MRSPYVVALALYAYALACCQSHSDAALAALDECIGMVGANTTRTVVPRSLALAARVRAAGGDLPHALDNLREAVDVAHSTGDRPAMAITLARAVFVLASHDPATSAVLSGVIGGGLLARQFAVLRSERERFDRTLDEIRAALGDDLYQEAAARGEALAYDDAIAIAWMPSRS